MQRIDLVVPSALAEDLRIPPMAITDGTADPEWVDVPMSRWRFRRRPSIRLPLDPDSARGVRWYTRLAPWSLVPGVVAIVAWLAWSLTELPGSGSLTALLVAGGVPLIWSLLPAGKLPDQAPSRNHLGDLRIPQVPLAVALEWTSGNPGVTATDEPAPPPRARRFYVRWAGGLVAAAVALFVALEVAGSDDYGVLWILVVVLFVAGVTVATKIEPSASD
jgi:hypothetical protein